MRCVLLSVSVLMASCWGAEPSGLRLAYDYYSPESVKRLPRYRNCLEASTYSTGQSINSQGVKGLRLSASAQFSPMNFQTVLDGMPAEWHPHQLLVLDVRNEEHGFINGTPVGWVSLNLSELLPQASAASLMQAEAHHLAELQQAGRAKVWLMPAPQLWRGSLEIAVEDAGTEAAFLSAQQVHYRRVPIALWAVPEDETVDALIRLLRGLGPQKWVHVHGGVSPWGAQIVTTMIDMMQNAQNVSLQDIIARQSVFGGEDLLEIPTSAEYNPQPWDRYYPPSAIYPPYRFDGDSLNGADPLVQNDPLNPFFLPMDATVVQLEVPGEAPEHVEARRERLNFLQDFYAYCRHVIRSHEKISWNEWVNKTVEVEVIGPTPQAMLKRTWSILQAMRGMLNASQAAVAAHAPKRF